MNVTSGEYGTQIDEFEVAELRMAVADLVDAPYVDDCPAVIACRLFKEVDLGSAPNTLIIGEAVGIRLSTHLTTVGDTHFVDPDGAAASRSSVRYELWAVGRDCPSRAAPLRAQH